MVQNQTDPGLIEIEIAQAFEHPDRPARGQGAGEGGIVPVGGVIANALAAALASFNAEPRALPLSRPRVWELIHRK